MNFTNVGNSEIAKFTYSDKSMGMYELNKKLTIAPGNNFIFNQINKLTIKIYSHQRYINISYYLKFKMPMCHRLFFRRRSQNSVYTQTH